MLLGRDHETKTLTQLTADAKAGRGGALLLRGEPGIGKTALLNQTTDLAGMRTLRCSGVESEAELPFAGLHQLLKPLLDQMGSLPPPQADALRSAFGLVATPMADRFLIGVAVLSLLVEAAEDAPLLCIVDDAQWMDQPTADALMFVARRLEVDSIAMVFAAREHAFPACGVGELPLTGLTRSDAAELVGRHGPGLNAEQRQRVLDQAGGNPLALIELATATNSNDTGMLPMTERLQKSFLDQVRQLSPASQTLLLVMACDDTGDVGLLLRAAEALGIPPMSALDGVEGQVRIECGKVSFRHPLVRAAVRQGAPRSKQIAVHKALAAVVDSGRRAWHLAAATTGPDEQVAAELERVGQEAAARSGFATASTAYSRAAQLTPGGSPYRQTLAAEAALEAGRLDTAHSIATITSTEDLDLRARLANVQVATGYSYGRLRRAHTLALEAVELLPDDATDRAMWILLESVFLGWQTGEQDLAIRTSEALDRRRPPAGTLVWDLARRLVDVQLQRPSGVRQPLHRLLPDAVATMAGNASAQVQLIGVGLVLGQDKEVRGLATSLVDELRSQGRLGLLPRALTYMAASQLFLGEHRHARADAEEALRIAGDTGQTMWTGQASSLLSYLAAVEGNEADCVRHAEVAIASDVPVVTAMAQWSLGLLDLSLGRVEQAVSRFQTVARLSPYYQLPGARSGPDLVEAAIRLGQTEVAGAALERFALWVGQTEEDPTTALLHRCKALLAVGDEAEKHFRLALDLHEAASGSLEQARTQLVFGQWLRRERRRTEAQPWLESALDTFQHLAAVPWAAQARDELGIAAAGRGTAVQLTPQEMQVARLAVRGMSNRDIAAQLFLSPRTIGYHLSNVYAKLGLSSRGELTAEMIH